MLLTNKHIGIFTYRGTRGFTQPDFFRQMIREGQGLGAKVFLFSTQDINLAAHTIRGFVPTTAGWKSAVYPWPDIVIDHYRYYPVAKHKNYLPFRRQKLFFFANNRFSNKWRVHQVLSQEAELQRWLPEAYIYSREQLANMLRRHKIIYIKPTNGTGGRSILRVERRSGGYLLLGRNKHQLKSTSFLPSLAVLSQRVESWITNEKSGDESFFIQQGLTLSLLPNRTIDTRLLIQKNENGEWKITGMGIRVGQVKSSTSNLHAGGKAVRALHFLSDYFGRTRALQIIQECHELAYKTVEKIEQHYGSMMEFGFDIGIDVDGRAWIIEINPKPGRDIFRKLGQPERYQLAVRRPIQYALYLMQNQKTG